MDPTLKDNRSHIGAAWGAWPLCCVTILSLLILLSNCRQKPVLLNPEGVTIVKAPVVNCKDNSCFSSQVFISISSGRRHTCGVSQDGFVYCWGDNYNGQCGIGDFIPRTIYKTPGVRWRRIKVPGIKNIVEVVTGEIHTCARTKTGEVFCWGDNGSGQLGQGDGEPLKGILKLSLDGVVHLAAGDYNTCALRRDDSLWCWGDNSSLQLGEGNRTIFLPTQVKGATEDGENLMVVGAASGTCLLKKSGDVLCWGYGGSPRIIPGVEEAKLIAAGGNEVCFVTIKGIGCLDLAGFFGERTYDPIKSCSIGYCSGFVSPENIREEPYWISGVTMTVVEDLACGTNHHCAVHDGGQVDCWGNRSRAKDPHPIKYYGDVYDDDFQRAGLGPYLMGVATIHVGPAVAVSVGIEHGCAALRGGGKKCWGKNRGGQLDLGVSRQELEFSIEPVQREVECPDGCFPDGKIGLEEWCYFLRSEPQDKQKESALWKQWRRVRQGPYLQYDQAGIWTVSGSFDNDQPHGDWVYRSVPDGIQIAGGYYHKGAMEGRWFFKSNLGSEVLLEGEFSKGVQVGWIELSEEGSLELWRGIAGYGYIIERYPDGRIGSFRGLGLITQSEPWKPDEEVTMPRFAQHGHSLFVVQPEGLTCGGPQIWLYPEGNPKKRGYCKGGLKHGTWQFFNKQGELIEERRYRYGEQI